MRESIRSPIDWEERVPSIEKIYIRVLWKSQFLMALIIFYRIISSAEFLGSYSFLKFNFYQFVLLMVVPVNLMA